MSTATTIDPYAAGILVPPGVMCARCRYDIRGMSNDAVCPECGLPTVDSLWAAEVRDAELGELRTTDEAWRRAMHRGMTLATASWAIAITGLFYPLTRTPKDALLGIAWLTPPVTAYVVGCWAAWVLATPRTRVEWATWMRASLILALTAIGLLFMNSDWGRFYLGLTRVLPRPGYASTFEAFEACGRFLMIACPIATGFSLARAAQLAWLSRHNASSAALVAVGVLSTVWAIAAYPVAVGRYGTSSTAIIYVISPVGSVSGVWSATSYALRAFDEISVRSLGGLISICMFALVVVASLGLGVMYMRIRGSIARSLALPMLRPPTPAMSRSL